MSFKVTVGYKWAPGAVYIGRGSPLGNPFPLLGPTQLERDQVCDAYADWFQRQLAESNPEVMAELRRLYRLAQRPEGVVLGCFCSPKRCHGETIKAFLEAMAPAHDDSQS